MLNMMMIMISVIIINAPVMGLRGGAKRPRGNDGNKVHRMQRINEVKEEYQNLAVLTDPLIQNNTLLQKVAKKKRYYITYFSRRRPIRRIEENLADSHGERPPVDQRGTHWYQR